MRMSWRRSSCVQVDLEVSNRWGCWDGLCLRVRTSLSPRLGGVPSYCAEAKIELEKWSQKRYQCSFSVSYPEHVDVVRHNDRLFVGVNQGGCAEDGTCRPWLNIFEKLGHHDTTH